MATLLMVPVATAGGAILPPQIHAVAGGGRCTSPYPLATGAPAPCEYDTATDDSILGARSVAALPGGGFLYIDFANDLVREVSPPYEDARGHVFPGVVKTVAGNGSTSDAPDGSRALGSGLDGPVAVAALPNGGFLITEYNGSRVRMVSPSRTRYTATITTIAGTGTPGNNGMLSGPATSVQLNYPTDAQPTPDGRVLIADTYNDYVRLLSSAAPGATLSTIAGGGSCNDVTTSCEGAAAGTVTLDRPVSVSPVRNRTGAYLLAEYDADAIREIAGLTASAALRTVAGTPGQYGYGGDGHAAASALLAHPQGVAALPGGGFLIADTDNERIREVSAAGTITTVAGNGQQGSQGDGYNATAAELSAPVAVSPVAYGDFLIADQDNNLIRVVSNAPMTRVSLSRPTGRDGWYIEPVHIAVRTNQAGAIIACTIDPIPPPPVFAAIRPGCDFVPPARGLYKVDGEHAFYAAAQNVFGDGELPVKTTFKVDVTPPTLVCAQVPPVFSFGQRAEVTATLEDAVSGPRSETVGTVVGTTVPGRKKVLVTGTNVAGKRGHAICPYTVLPPQLQPLPRLRWTLARAAGAATIVNRLSAWRVPIGAKVTLNCVGSCPFVVWRTVAGAACPKQRKNCRRPAGIIVNFTPLFAHVAMPAESILTLVITERGHLGRVWQLAVANGRTLSHAVACLLPDSTTPGKGCK